MFVLLEVNNPDLVLLVVINSEIDLLAQLLFGGYIFPPVALCLFAEFAPRVLLPGNKLPSY